jgi:hypothetical protein
MARRGSRWLGRLAAIGGVLWVALPLRATPQQPAAARSVAARETAAPASSSAAPYQALLDKYCVTCHDNRRRTAGLSFSDLDVANLAGHSDVWEKVTRKLRGRTMPPIGRVRPDGAAYDEFIAYLETSLDRIASGSPNPGRTETFRRMTRTEYRNAVRDLLDVDVDVASLLPPDDSSYGFDNVTVGGLSPTLMERYLSAAQKISRLVVGQAPRGATTYTMTLPVDLTQERHLPDLPLGTRGGTTFRYTFPVDATYEIQVRLYRDRNEHVEGLTQPHELEVSLDAVPVKVFAVTPPQRARPGAAEPAIEYEDSYVDKDFNIRVPVSAGPHQVTATFLQKSSPLLESTRDPYPVAFNMDRHPRQQPALYSVAITGPFEASGVGDTPSRRRVFTCRPTAASQEADCAKRILGALTRRAYRRPVTDADLQVPLSFFKEGRAGGDFDDGIELAVRKLLVSPEFLFRIERDPSGRPPGTVYRVSDLELATRLSFFLWSSIPDDELIDIAARGRLRDPAELERQVKRMLADPRAHALVGNFADQWLYLRNLAAASPDARMFPVFDDNLRRSFRRETELFFASIMTENRSVLDLLRADYTFLDERLAKHYGIAGVYGTGFRRVTLPAGSVRGGLLGQGSILIATSYANRTSPVIRGKWVLENIIGSPPPPPPPDVPPLRENKSEHHALTMRERMAQHREDPSCNSCHRMIDPIGLSLENFDAIGRWRTRGEDGAPVDASGGLPDGSTFEGVTGLKQALLARPEGFVRTVSEKLLTYALGRGIEPYDGPAVRTILRDSARDDYRFETLVLNIVRSTPFQFRRSP